MRTMTDWMLASQDNYWTTPLATDFAQPVNDFTTGITVPWISPQGQLEDSSSAHEVNSIPLNSGPSPPRR
jgi:hypothetical protein